MKKERGSDRNTSSFQIHFKGLLVTFIFYAYLGFLLVKFESNEEKGSGGHVNYAFQPSLLHNISGHSTDANTRMSYDGNYFLLRNDMENSTPSNNQNSFSKIYFIHENPDDTSVLDNIIYNNNIASKNYDVYLGNNRPDDELTVDNSNDDDNDNRKSSTANNSNNTDRNNNNINMKEKESNLILFIPLVVIYFVHMLEFWHSRSWMELRSRVDWSTAHKMLKSYTTATPVLWWRIKTYNRKLRWSIFEMILPHTLVNLLTNYSDADHHRTSQLPFRDERANLLPAFDIPNSSEGDNSVGSPEGPNAVYSSSVSTQPSNTFKFMSLSTTTTNTLQSSSSSATSSMPSPSLSSNGMSLTNKSAPKSQPSCLSSFSSSSSSPPSLSLAFTFVPSSPILSYQTHSLFTETQPPNKFVDKTFNCNPSYSTLYPSSSSSSSSASSPLVSSSSTSICKLVSSLEGHHSVSRGDISLSLLSPPRPSSSSSLTIPSTSLSSSASVTLSSSNISSSTSITSSIHCRSSSFISSPTHKHHQHHHRYSRPRQSHQQIVELHQNNRAISSGWNPPQMQANSPDAINHEKLASKFFRLLLTKKESCKEFCSAFDHTKLSVADNTDLSVITNNTSGLVRVQMEKTFNFSCEASLNTYKKEKRTFFEDTFSSSEHNNNDDTQGRSDLYNSNRERNQNRFVEASEKLDLVSFSVDPPTSPTSRRAYNVVLDCDSLFIISQSGNKRPWYCRSMTIWSAALLVLSWPLRLLLGYKTENISYQIIKTFTTKKQPLQIVDEISETSSRTSSRMSSHEIIRPTSHIRDHLADEVEPSELIKNKIYKQTQVCDNSILIKCVNNEVQLDSITKLCKGTTAAYSTNTSFHDRKQILTPAEKFVERNGNIVSNQPHDIIIDTMLPRTGRNEFKESEKKIGKSIHYLKTNVDEIDLHGRDDIGMKEFDWSSDEAPPTYDEALNMSSNYNKTLKSRVDCGCKCHRDKVLPYSIHTSIPCSGSEMETINVCIESLRNTKAYKSPSNQPHKTNIHQSHSNKRVQICHNTFLNYANDVPGNCHKQSWTSLPSGSGRRIFGRLFQNNKVYQTPRTTIIQLMETSL